MGASLPGIAGSSGIALGNDWRDGKLRVRSHHEKHKTMPALKSRLDTRSDEFKANAASLQRQVEDLRAKAAEIALGGDAKSRERHAARGKLLPRERVDGLLDPGSADRKKVVNGMSRAVNCFPATASSGCSIPDRPFSRSASSPPSACTTARRRPLG
jgi:hypothetical protein